VVEEVGTPRRGREARGCAGQRQAERIPPLQTFLSIPHSSRQGEELPWELQNILCRFQRRLIMLLGASGYQQEEE